MGGLTSSPLVSEEALGPCLTTATLILKAFNLERLLKDGINILTHANKASSSGRKVPAPGGSEFPPSFKSSPFVEGLRA